MTKESKAAQKTAGDEEREEGRPSGNAHPKIDFSTFMLSLFTTAQLQLGEIPNPYTQKFEEDLMMAGETIDIMAMLEKKTAGNLTNEEAKLVEDLLYNLRMTYVRKMEKEKAGVRE